MSPITTLDPKDITPGQMFSNLLAAVTPRPIAFVSTIDKESNVNISPFSFFNAFSVNPPILIFSSSRRVRDGTNKHTIENILEVGEVVVNTVNYPMVEQMSLASTEYKKGINEFVKAGLTQVASDVVAPPRVAESPVAMECVIDQIIETGTGGGAGNIVIARVVKIHIQNQYLGENGKVDTHKLDMVGRMGGSWYCRASGDALFEIPKPLRTKGIGIDQLPDYIRHSDLLTGNQLGRLGNIEQLPKEETILSFIRSSPELEEIVKNANNNRSEKEQLLRQKAINLLENGETEAALKVLLYIELLAV